ncbi:hypothetical protein BpHYR1_002406 [Brachionus plicatilis]|uniref:Uncharacterized protein n=1 Tax=Brachionus plicatilis TaxID=10195 RepID=A0A3M7PLL6_BRAPC|nr:hypothetical protein BpHYR1_002406 [Brachionus plicatilis]
MFCLFKIVKSISIIKEFIDKVNFIKPIAAHPFNQSFYMDFHCKNEENKELQTLLAERYEAEISNTSGKAMYFDSKIYSSYLLVSSLIRIAAFEKFLSDLNNLTEYDQLVFLNLN